MLRNERRTLHGAPRVDDRPPLPPSTLDMRDEMPRRGSSPFSPRAPFAPALLGGGAHVPRGTIFERHSRALLRSKGLGDLARMTDFPLLDGITVRTPGSVPCLRSEEPSSPRLGRPSPVFRGHPSERLPSRPESRSRFRRRGVDPAPSARLGKTGEVHDREDRHPRLLPSRLHDLSTDRPRVETELRRSLRPRTPMRGGSESRSGSRRPPPTF